MKSQLKKYTVELLEDPESGDLILPFPTEVWTEMVTKHGWAEGDVIHWKENADGSWELSKRKHRAHKPRTKRPQRPKK